VDLRRLQYFAVLAEELHFRRAAERLHIAQPGLSQQIRVLERELGAVLFERTTAGVTLTPAGHALRDEGVPLLREVERVAALVRAAAEGRTGRLRIVHTRSLAGALPDELVHQFRREHPEAEIGVETAWTARNVAMVRAAEADAAFVRLPLEDADDLRLLTLGSTELVVTLPATHPLARKRVVRPDDLRDVHLVAWPHEQAPGYYDHVRAAVWGENPPPVTATEPDPEHLLAAVAAGAVCVLDADRAARLRPRGVLVRRFARPTPTADFGLVWSPHRAPPLLQAFITHCRDKVRTVR
jgi:DNA-binding transcriptional LysR family regulator